jgi:hypothetical protein
MAESQSSPPGPVTRGAYVVYLRDSGRIVHTHQVVVYPGAIDPTDDEMAAEARELAATASDKGADLDVLAVHPDDLRPGAFYRVDLKQRRLVKDDDREEEETT